MSTGTYSLIKTVITGESITATDRNAEHTGHITHAEPDGVGGHSDSIAEMRQTTDPYPAGSPSLATALAGEIERLRYLIAQITGETYWYVDPDFAITGLLPGPAGTKAWFYQDTAPTGWTLDATPSDALLAVKGGTTYTTGGAQVGTWTQPNHTHNGPSHTHATSDHVLTIAEMPLHTHGMYINATGLGGGNGWFMTTSGSENNTSPTGGDTAHSHGNTGAGGTGATDGGATANTWRPLAQVGIICQRS